MPKPHKPDAKESSRETAALRASLLAWFEANKRDLPWRGVSDPYAIWVSEIMLQQTRVAAVIDRYTAFLSRFPTMMALAAVPESDVLALWSGLGYYRRARMLHKAAQVVVADYGGALPATAAELRKLPGIGAYTAAAIASIAHGEVVAVVDGNVERVIARLAGWDEGTPALRRKVEERAALLLDTKRAGDFNQAMMELGATVCTPRGPQCLVCPVRKHCKTQGEHKTAPRAKMETRAVGCALVLRSRKGVEEVLLEQRAASQSVMPGLWELPVLRSAEVPAEDLRLSVRHAIMQVNYDVRVCAASEREGKALTVVSGERRWVGLDEAASLPLTGLARKILKRLRLLHEPGSVSV